LYRQVVKLQFHKHIGWDGAAEMGESGIAKLFHQPGEEQQPQQTSKERMHELASPLVTAFNRLTGDPSRVYGLANMDALSVKRQRTLPAGPCTVYDLLNFASEVATHHSDEYGSRCCQAWIGQLVSGEYDLELSRQSFGEFKDFFMERNLNGEVARDLEQAGAQSGHGVSPMAVEFTGTGTVTQSDGERRYKPDRGTAPVSASLAIFAGVGSQASDLLSCARTMEAGHHMEDVAGLRPRHHFPFLVSCSCSYLKLSRLLPKKAVSRSANPERARRCVGLRALPLLSWPLRSIRPTRATPIADLLSACRTRALSESTVRLVFSGRSLRRMARDSSFATFRA
jgi:hypothetical protein